jgi:UDP-glucose 4-epimerase
MLQDCDAAHNLKFMALRYFNAAGADKSGKLGERHEPETHLIPLILKVATAEREQVKIFGTDYPTPDGTCIRDYIHVSDLAQAHLLALDALLSGKDSAIYNLGNSKGYSVREVIDVARKITGHEIPAVESDPRPGDPAVLVADSAKIRKELRWQPRFEDLENIIQSAWDWHQFDKVRGHNANTVFE